MTGHEPRWLSATEQQMWRAYLRGSRELEATLECDLHPLGLSLAEYEIISMLSEAPDGRFRMSQLAELVVQSRSRVTHTAARLEKRGWVGREPAPDDGRGVVLCLTEAGREVVERVAVEHVASVRRHLVDVLTPEQMQALGTAMQAVSEALAPQCSEAVLAQ